MNDKPSLDRYTIMVVLDRILGLSEWSCGCDRRYCNCSTHKDYIKEVHSEIMDDYFDSSRNKIEHFTNAIIQDPNLKSFMNNRMCCNGYHCGCQGATIEEYLLHISKSYK